MVLPVVVYRVGHTCFRKRQMKAMIKRTNRKLAPASIQIEVEGLCQIRDVTLSYVPENPGTQDSNVERLLEYGRGKPKTLRIFLIKKSWEGEHDAWTLDPVEDPKNEELYGGAIFITEFFNRNTDDWYEFLGYCPSCDTLQHELGHVLMRKTEKDHVTGSQPNFFHNEPAKSDDSMTDAQIEEMRTSPYLRLAV
jgi:hypothetical protein